MKRENQRPIATALLDRSGDHGPSMRDLFIFGGVASLTVIYVSYVL